MLVTRREAIRKTTLTAIGMRVAFGAGTIGVGLSLEGCNLFNDILNWVPVGEASLNSILSILTANGIIIAPAISALVTTIEAGFTALTAAIKEYRSVTPPPVGAEAKIQAAFTAVVDNFKTFLSSLSVPGSIFSVISGIAQVVLSTIAAFENQLPVTTTATATARTSIVGDSVRVSGQVVIITPKHRTRRAYKKDFNAVLDAGVKLGVNIPLSAYHHVSLLERL